MLLHDGASGDFFGALAIAAGALSGFLDVFVLALLFAAGTAKMFFTWHIRSSSVAKVLRECDELQVGKTLSIILFVS